MGCFSEWEQDSVIWVRSSIPYYVSLGKLHNPRVLPEELASKAQLSILYVGNASKGCHVGIDFMGYQSSSWWILKAILNVYLKKKAQQQSTNIHQALFLLGILESVLSVLMDACSYCQLYLSPTASKALEEDEEVLRVCVKWVMLISNVIFGTGTLCLCI